MPDKIHKTDFTIRISMVILAITGVLAYINTSDLIEKNMQVNHTHEVIARLEEVQSVIADAETGQRGYLLTGKPAYLIPYKDAVSRLSPIMDYISSLTKENYSQQRKIYNLRININKKMAELKETIDLKNQGKYDEAIAIVMTDSGQIYMDNIRKNIGDMKEVEQDLLDFRLKISNNTAYRCLWVFPVLIIVDIIITNLSLTFIRMERIQNLKK